MEKTDNIMIISNKDIKDYIWALAQKALRENEITLQYKDKYASKVNSLIYYLEKSFGWEIKENLPDKKVPRQWINEEGKKETIKITINQKKIGKLDIWKQ